MSGYRTTDPNKIPALNDTETMADVDLGDYEANDVITVDLDAKDGDGIVVEDKANDEPTDEQVEELRQVSDKRQGRYQRRIDKITYEAAEAARQRDAEAAARRAAEEENQRLRAQLNDADQRGAAYRESQIASMRAAREEALTNAEDRLERAIQDGDAKAQAKASSEISRLTSELAVLATQAVRRQAPPEQRQQEQPQQRQQEQPQQRPHPKLIAWVEKNQWFNRPGSEARTNAAREVYYGLQSRGIREDNPNFYAELDKGIAEIYPDHVPMQNSGGGSRRQPGPSVPSGGRENGANDQGNGRQVTLTPSEVAIARRMNVPLPQYAAEKMRLQKGGAR